MLKPVGITIDSDKTDDFLKMMRKNVATEEYWSQLRKDTVDINISRIDSLIDEAEVFE